MTAAPFTLAEADLWVLVVAVFGFNTILACYAFYKDDLSIVDIFWSIMFLIPNLILLIARIDYFNLDMAIVIVLVTIWSLRLSIHIGVRHKGEDYRYVKIKSNWKD